MRCDKCGSVVGNCTKQTHINAKVLLNVILTRKRVTLAIGNAVQPYFTCDELEGIINEMLQGVKF